MPLQHSIVFNQVTWTGAGDVDDCWVLSSIQANNVVNPARGLVTVPRFRKGAGDPDDGKNDGGNVAEIIKGSIDCWPELKGKLIPMRGDSFAKLQAAAQAGRPVSIAVVSGSLPTRLQFGFKGLHQVTIVQDGDLLLANPLAPAQSRWEPVAWSGLQPAVLDYGKAKAGHPGVWAVVWPTLAELAPPPPPAPDCSAEHAAGFADAKAKALAAVNGIK